MVEKTQDARLILATFLYRRKTKMMTKSLYINLAGIYKELDKPARFGNLQPF
jgi:hypothetical protein